MKIRYLTILLAVAQLCFAEVEKQTPKSIAIPSNKQTEEQLMKPEVTTERITASTMNVTVNEKPISMSARTGYSGPLVAQSQVRFVNKYYRKPIYGPRPPPSALYKVIRRTEYIPNHRADHRMVIVPVYHKTALPVKLYIKPHKKKGGKVYLPIVPMVDNHGPAPVKWTSAITLQNPHGQSYSSYKHGHITQTHPHLAKVKLPIVHELPPEIPHEIQREVNQGLQHGLQQVIPQEHPHYREYQEHQPALPLVIPHGHPHYYYRYGGYKTSKKTHSNTVVPLNSFSEHTHEDVHSHDEPPHYNTYNPSFSPEDGFASSPPLHTQESHPEGVDAIEGNAYEGDSFERYQQSYSKQQAFEDARGGNFHTHDATPASASYQQGTHELNYVRKPMQFTPSKEVTYTKTAGLSAHASHPWGYQPPTSHPATTQSHSYAQESRPQISQVPPQQLQPQVIKAPEEITPSVAASVVKQESMIANGWTPIINNQ